MHTPLRRLLNLALCVIAAIPASGKDAPWTPVGKIVFVGNSITRHAPSERLGWSGDWGMAATTRERDHVHRLVALIAETQAPAPAPGFEVFARGGGHLPGLLDNTTHLAALRGDLIVLQMGENDHTATETGFYEPYRQVVSILRAANPTARLVCTGIWNPPRGNAAKDAFIRRVCAENRLFFADLAAVNAAPANRAGNAAEGLHQGVGWHPGDAGMEGYARSILAALQAGEASIPPPTGETRLPTRPAAASLVLEETFDSASALGSWTPSPNGRIEDASLKITNPDPAASITLRRRLPSADLAGRTLKISARLRAENLSAPPRRWNGVKLMLDLMDAEAVHDYPQARVETRADLDWHEVSFTRHIPDNTVQLLLVLGLEQVSGAVWFDDLRVETVD